MSTLIISHLQTQHANARAAYWLINSAPLMATNLFAHALASRCGAQDVHPKVALIHHDTQLLGERGDYDVFLPQQRRGAVAFNKKDYAGGSGMNVAQQPFASFHGTFSLLLNFDGPPPELKAVEDFLYRASFAGGKLIGHDAVMQADTSEALVAALPTGPSYWIVDRSDLMHGHTDPVQGLFNGLELGAIAVEQTKREQPPPDALPGSWLVPLVRGYALLRPPTQRHGVRSLHTGENPLHAFAEPVVGLGQYVSLRQWGERPIPFWSAAWAREDLFLLTQASTANNTTTTTSKTEDF